MAKFGGPPVAKPQAQDDPSQANTKVATARSIIRGRRPRLGLFNSTSMPAIAGEKKGGAY